MVTEGIERREVYMQNAKPKLGERWHIYMQTKYDVLICFNINVVI
jgi:hypothetical protein